MTKRLIIMLVLLAPALACAKRPSFNTAANPQSSIVNRQSAIVLLGTGTPNADPDRYGPATAIVVRDTPYLVDCGPGVVRRAAAARRGGVPALAPANLRRLFITHLHSDHTLGLPDLILSPWVLGRSEPLVIYGPPGTRRMTDHLLEAYCQDIDQRITGLEPANPGGYKVSVHEIEPGEIYRDENVVVTAFPVRHGSWPHAFGFRFETPDRTIVLSGDTTPCASLIDNARGCDVLVHEVYSQKGFQRRAPVWQRYHAASHTSTDELAAIATRTRPGLLILNHQLFWGTTEEELLQEIGRSYDGKVISGKDLDIH